MSAPDIWECGEKRWDFRGKKRKVKRILITGAGSYIGMTFEKWMERYKDFEVDTLDMREEAWREYDFSGYDSVFHVAGIAHADTGKVSEERKALYYRVNCDLAVETAQKAKEAGVGQFLYMSSMIVYGKLEHITKDTKPKPANFYGDSKWQAEQEIYSLQEEDFKVAILRPPMVYGKGCKGNYQILSKMAKSLPVFPKINNKRSMLYIENLCEFLFLIIKTEEKGIFFPQNKELVNTSELVSEIARLNGHTIWITSLLRPAVILGKYLPGKMGNLCRKAFGNSYYELEISNSTQLDYSAVNFKETVRRTEQ